MLEGRSELYLNLGVSPEATPDDIERVYQQLLDEHDPTTHPDDPDVAWWREKIETAYAVLRNPEARGLYDEMRKKGDPETKKGLSLVEPEDDTAEPLSMYISPQSKKTPFVERFRQTLRPRMRERETMEIRVAKLRNEKNLKIKQLEEQKETVLKNLDRERERVIEVLRQQAGAKITEVLQRLAHDQVRALVEARSIIHACDGSTASIRVKYQTLLDEKDKDFDFAIETMKRKYDRLIELARH